MSSLPSSQTTPLTVPTSCFVAMLLKITKMITNDIAKATMNNEYDQLDEYHGGEHVGLQGRRCFLPMPPFLCLTTSRMLLMKRVSTSNIMHCIRVTREFGMASKSQY